MNIAPNKGRQSVSHDCSQTFKIIVDQGNGAVVTNFWAIFSWFGMTKESVAILAAVSNLEPVQIEWKKLVKYDESEDRKGLIVACGKPNKAWSRPHPKEFYNH